jgi:ABC-type oligopeptide transport system substrate-binding subunit
MRGPKISRRTTLKALAAAAIVRPASGIAQTQRQKVLRYQFEVAESGFDPVQLSDLYSRIVTANIFDNLYRYDHLARPFKIKPNTAAAMPEHSADFRTWTVRVRPGIFFQDDLAFGGKPRELTAHDYVYSWKRFFDPRWKAPAFASLNELQLLGMAPLREAALTGKAVRLRHRGRGSARAGPLHDPLSPGSFGTAAHPDAGRRRSIRRGGA